MLHIWAIFLIEIRLKYENVILLSSSRAFSLSTPTFSCLPLWTTVRLYGKKATKCNKDSRDHLFFIWRQIYLVWNLRFTFLRSVFDICNRKRNIYYAQLIKIWLETNCTAKMMLLWKVNRIKARQKGKTSYHLCFQSYMVDFTVWHLYVRYSYLSKCAIALRCLPFVFVFTIHTTENKKILYLPIFTLKTIIIFLNSGPQIQRIFKVQNARYLM